MRDSTKTWCKGFALFLFGSAGMAENITSGRGSFLISAILWAVGFSLILYSYIVKDYQKKGKRS